jgi:hypothetical protein
MNLFILIKSNINFKHFLHEDNTRFNRREEICQLYNGLAGGRWNLMKIAQIVALPYLRMGSKSFFS